MEKSSDVTINILKPFQSGISILIAITLCIPQLKITKNDLLSKTICPQCYEMIKKFYYFREHCLELDSQQRVTSTNLLRKRKVVCIEQHPRKKAKVIDTRKFGQIKAELTKALGGELPEQFKEVDNIILEVHSEDETETEAHIAFKDKNTKQQDSTKLVKLPDGIRVSLTQAKKGKCIGKIIKGTCNTDFCLVDGYLFDFRLCKGNLRYVF